MQPKTTRSKLVTNALEYPWIGVNSTSQKTSIAIQIQDMPRQSNT